MIFASPQLSEVYYVCQHLRPSSREEMMLTIDEYDPAMMAKFLMRSALSWVGFAGERPSAVIGAYPMHPGVWGLFGYGTESYCLIIREMTRHARRVMMPAVKAAGAHRAQCMSPVSHTDTHKWLRLLGAKEEGTLRRYGKNGEDVIMFAWTGD